MSIFYGIIQWILSVAEILLCYYFCDALIDNGLVKRNWLYVGSWSVVIGTLLDINRYLGFMSWSMIILQSILIFLSLIKTCMNKLYCFGVVMTYNVFVALFQLFNAFVFLVFGKQISVDEIYYEFNLYRMICYLITLLIIYVILVGFRRYNKNIDIKLEILKWGFLIYGTIGMFVVLIFQMQMLTYGKFGSMKNTFFLSILLVITFFVFFLYIRYFVARSEYQMLELKSKMMAEHYQEMYQMYQNCACTIHDFKNHLLLLEDYCKSGQCQKALAYIEKIREPLHDMENYIKSGNEVIDLILNFKLSEAEDKGITVETKIDSMCGVLVEDNDLCSIFSNLVDNAIEACNYVEQGEKWIKISVARHGDMLVVKIENSYGNKLHEEQGRFHTSKKGLHGYGMKSVKLKVEQYGGNVQWNYTDDVFTAVVTFFNITKIQKKKEIDKYGKKSG